MEDGINGSCMVFHIEPVAYIFSLAINRKRLAVVDVVDEQGYQLLRKLIWTVVVRAVGHNGRESVGIVECPDKVVTAGLCCTIRAMRLIFQIFGKELLSVCEVMLSAGCFGCERRFYAFGVCHLQGTIHLVGTDVVETLSFISFRQTFPIHLCGLVQTQCSHHVRLGEGKGIFDGPVHVTLCGKAG